MPSERPPEGSTVGATLPQVTFQDQLLDGGYWGIYNLSCPMTNMYTRRSTVSMNFELRLVDGGDSESDGWLKRALRPLHQVNQEQILQGYLLYKRVVDESQDNFV